MSSNENHAPSIYKLRQYGATLRALGVALGAWLGRIANNVSPPYARKTRRQLRRWWKIHGLTIVLVSLMMALAWMVAER
jgi:hypothetical protein